MDGQQQRLKALEALKRASKDLETDEDGGCNSPSMKALLHLENGSDDLFSGDPHLSTLSHLLSRLKSLASTLHSKHGDAGRGILRSLLRRRTSGHEISLVAGSIGSEIQSWIDRESIHRLLAALKSRRNHEDELVELLLALQSRAEEGFDRGFQDALLESAAFAAVESALADPTASDRVREAAAGAVLAMVRFNKGVFSGQVLMGPTVKTLLSMASDGALRVLKGLVSAIRSPIVDEIHAKGGIPTIVGLIRLSEGAVIAAADCAFEIGYLGRKEAIDAMLEEGLIKRLMELQRSDLGGTLIEIEMEGRRRPFASCVARFAIQMEVGEGLRQREKREMKSQVVRRVREAALSDAEAATVLAEVLWGSTPW